MNEINPVYSDECQIFFHKKTINIVIIKYIVHWHISSVHLSGHLQGKQVAIFSLLPPWRQPHIWAKHVAGHFILKLHSYIQMHLLVV